MAVKSMTGFARADGTIDAWRWVWEVRSVNGRGLDMRVRLPAGFDALDPMVRKALQGRLKRGSVTVSLNATRVLGTTQLQINQDALAQVLTAAEQVRQATDARAPSVDGLLALKGVLELAEPTTSDETRQAMETAMMATFDTAVEALVAARSAEGARLAPILTGHIDTISALTTKIETSPGRSAEAIQQRLKEQVARLTDTRAEFDEARLHQEAVLLATRADVEEELKRLQAHTSAAKQLLESEDAIGRQLDFLAQEFNREANTICSKAGSDDISQAGLALKAVIDQLREQVQNIE